MTDSSTPVAATPSLWRHSDFVKLWIGQTASQFGTQITQLTVPLVAIVALGVDSEQIGLLRAAGQVPFLLFALFVGVLVDWWRGRAVLILADFGRALALAAVPIAYAFHVLGISTLYVVAFSVGICTVFFDVAYQAYLFRLVDRAQLVQGNSMLEGSRSAAQIGGPALGGGLTTLLTAPVAIVASCVAYLVSVVSIWRIRKPELVPERAGTQTGAFRQIGEGLVLIARDTVLRTVAVVAGVYNFCFAAFMTVYLLFLPRELGLSGTEVGLAVAALGPGFLVGSVLAWMLPKRLGYGAVLVLAASISDGVMLLVAALHGSGVVTVGALMVINFVFAVFGMMFNVALMAVRQAITPDHIQGRATATIRFIGLGLAPVGSALGGYVADAIGLRLGVLLTAAGMYIAAVAVMPSPLARLGRTLPASEAEIR